MSESFLGITNIGWTAISAIATSWGVLIALFLPFYQNEKRNKSILHILEKELQENYSLIKKYLDFNDIDTRILNKKANIVHNWHVYNSIPLKLARYIPLRDIQLNVWDEFKYQLASYKPEEYVIFRELNQILVTIIQNVPELDDDCPKNHSFSFPGIEMNPLNLFIKKYEEAFIY